MAVRYSGDVEVRLRYDPSRRAYVGTVRDPDYRWHGVYEGRPPRDSRDYDGAAKEMILAADRDCRREAGRRLEVERDPGDRGGVTIRRVFQAPCPIRISTAGDLTRSNRGRW